MVRRPVGRGKETRETGRSAAKSFAKLVLNHRGYRKAWPRERFFLRARRHTPVVAVDAGGARYFVSTADEAVGLGLFAHGTHEREQLAAVSAVLSELPGGRQEPLRDAVFLDIGANIGTSTVEALVSFGASRGIALEPHPGNFKLLRHNLLENDLEDRVELMQAAASDSEGTVELEVAKVNMGDHRVRVADVSGGAGRMGEESRETVEVPSHRIDSLTADGTIDTASLGLAWIDTQGHEAHVLAGADVLFEAAVPIYAEYWPYALSRAGGLERFHQIVAERASGVCDIGFGDAAGVRPAWEMGVIAAKYDPEDPAAATNLLLVP